MFATLYRRSTESQEMLSTISSRTAAATAQYTAAMAPQIQTTISPYTQKPVLTRPLLSKDQLEAAVADAVKVQKTWRKVSLDDRIAIAEKWVGEFEKNAAPMAEDISTQMGRPIKQCAGEINGTLYRAKHLISIARKCLGPTAQPETDTESVKRHIVRTPLGVVLTIVPWNFPFLTMINAVIPAVLSGNALLIKPAPQTPTPAERIQQSFAAAGLPDKVIQVLHLAQDDVLELVADPRLDFVSFTGSVAGGRAIAEAAAKGKGFKGVALELGGKDPAYVREDADIAYTAEQLVDGAFFNSGESCCSVERIYVHASVYDQFVESFVNFTKGYKLGDPADESTTLGPVVSLASAERIRKQVAEAVAAGAKSLVPESHFPEAKEGTTVVGPQVLIDVTHEMSVMTEETFGPVVGIQKVESDEEALELMNDSHYGVTASVWTNPDSEESKAVFESFVEDLETGTVFLNRCDCPDPSLPWTGVKDSGRGISLSTYGYDQLTRAKGVNMKVKLA